MEGALRGFLTVLYVAGLLVFLMVLLTGLPYYLLPLSERPHSDLHATLRPAGAWGHGLGVIGSSLIVLLFLYSARKRRRFGLRFGKLKHWLNVHILFGIIGPLLVTLHTAMKFNGIVSVSYFSMMAVMLSGFFGRYIYMQIPRDPRGAVLTLDQIQRRLEKIDHDLAARSDLPQQVRHRLQKLSDITVRRHESGFRAIAASIGHGIALPYRTRRVRRYLTARKKDVPRALIGDIVRMTREKALLKRKIAVLNTMRRIFHLWHVIHRPFAYIMVAIMILHVVVTVALGYKWVF